MKNHLISVPVPACQPVRGYCLFLFTLSGLLWHSSATAAECRLWQEQDAQRRDLRVGHITVETGNIFDPDNPKENRWYNRAANRLHVNTRAEVVQRHLLFRSGEAFDAARLRESERLLRARHYLKEAVITPVQVCGGEVDIQVRTSDNWTLMPGLDAGHSGGETSGGIKIEEHNLLGWGKALGFSYQQDSNRSETKLGYHDPGLFGTRHELTFGLLNNSDGRGYLLDLELPFYAFDSREAWGLEVKALEQEVPFYEQGEVARRIGEDKRSGKLFYGWSGGRQGDHTERYLLGWQYLQQSWFPTDTSAYAAPDIVQSYPWIGYEYVQDDFITRENFRTMGRTEDIALGHRFTISAGWLSRGLGSEGDYLKLDAAYSKGFMPGDRQLGLLELEGSTWIGTGQLSGGRLSARGEWNHFTDDRSGWHLAGVFRYADNLLPGEQLVLGGDSGLRGYPTGFQGGDRSLLLSAERRFYFDWYPMRAARIGAAVFADAGGAWGRGQPAEWLGDVGVGLRIVSTRSSTGKVLHVDIAKPLTATGDTDSYQVLVGTQTEF
ncbi:MAG: BamA/TamA family outer membrane protein [Thiothrix sp.]|nr:BamA/TamA family outer membrane protein [Thiothrix sp.]HPE60081.1 BamA/TamA family outer membrane protein [Thiolinea sp.]